MLPTPSPGEGLTVSLGGGDLSVLVGPGVVRDGLKDKDGVTERDCCCGVDSSSTDGSGTSGP